jgi:hypothetical protein
MEPLTFAEDVERRKRSMLPMALSQSPGGTLSNAVQPGQALTKTLAQLAADARKKAADLEETPDDYSQLQGFARQQGESGQAAMLNALAAQYAGEGFQPVQAQFLKRAAAAQDPIKVGGGVITTDGQFLKDPGQDKARRIERLESMALAYDKADALNRESQANRDARERHNQVMEELGRGRLAMMQTNAGRGDLQQGMPFSLPDGSVVQGMFDPARGFVMDTPTGRVPLPVNARPTTPSAGGPLPAGQFNKLLQDLDTERSSLGKLDRYFSTLQDTNVGFARLADQISANAKTFLGQPLNSQELSRQVAQGQLQGLLGLFRTDIVGPGAMTEYDAQRVLQALGGDVNALQNPQVVERLLRDMYESKKRTVNTLQRQVDYSSRFFPGVAMPGGQLPPFGGGDNSGGVGDPPPGAVRRKP